LKNALVLAAGVGKRLAGLSENRPKSMFIFNGKPILYYTLKKLLSADYSNICVVTGYESEQIENYIGTNFKNIKTVFNKNFLSQGNFKSLRIGLNKLGDIPQVTVLDADLIFDRKILDQISPDKNEIVTSKIVVNHDPVYVKVLRNRISFLSKNFDYSAKSNHEYIGIFNININNIKIFKEISYEDKLDYEEVVHKNRLEFSQLDVSGLPWYEIDDKLHFDTISNLSNEIKGKLFEELT
jgi:choline kinase